MIAERSGLLSYEEALATVLEHARPIGTERIPIASALGRVLTGKSTSTTDLPPFDSSAVDGYAISEPDVETGVAEGPFVVVGEAKAGASPPAALVPGTTVRVFTGAPLPEGTGAVVMQEHADSTDGQVVFRAEVTSGDHVRRQGEECHKGDVILEDGLLGPAQVATLAASGNHDVEVFRQPRVALLVTGDELCVPGRPLGPGQIYESNGVALACAVQALGLPPIAVGRAADSRGQVEMELAKILDVSDVVLTSGGVSVGDYDLVRPAFQKLGVDQVFWGVAVKPGKPLYFGLKGAKAVFGLPGNPVSALVTYLLFVRPYLCEAMGVHASAPTQACTLLERVEKRAGRTEFVPSRIEGNGVRPLVHRASHKSSALADANGLLVFPLASTHLEAGDSVDVIPINWGLPW